MERRKLHGEVAEAEFLTAFAILNKFSLEDTGTGAEENPSLHFLFKSPFSPFILTSGYTSSAPSCLFSSSAASLLFWVTNQP